MGLLVGRFRYWEDGSFRVRNRLSFQLTFLWHWPARAMPHKTATRIPSKKLITIALASIDQGHSMFPKVNFIAHLNEDILIKLKRNRR